MSQLVCENPEVQSRKETESGLYFWASSLQGYVANLSLRPAIFVFIFVLYFYNNKIVIALFPSQFLQLSINFKLDHAGTSGTLFTHAQYRTPRNALSVGWFVRPSVEKYCIERGRYLGNEKSYRRSAGVKTTEFSRAFWIFQKI